MVHSVSTWVQQRYLWLIGGPLSPSFVGRDYRLSPENAVEPSSPLFLGSYEVRLLLLGRESLEGLKGGSRLWQGRNHRRVGCAPYRAFVRVQLGKLFSRKPATR